jgi:Cu/Ag efflux pump CusA
VLKGLLVFGLTRRPIILLGLLVFVGAGIIAFTKLNIEAYPNPAPVILEITAQSAGLSAEEMERYYTIPMEVGLAPTPGVDNIRSESFYGLSFVRVTFKYGVDYYFALTQANISLQQNVSLPNGVVPQIQGSSLVGEVYRAPRGRAYELTQTHGSKMTGLKAARPSPAPGSRTARGASSAGHQRDEARDRCAWLPVKDAEIDRIDLLAGRAGEGQPRKPAANAAPMVG